MSSAVIAAIVFVCVFGSALLGTFIRSRLPEHHLSQDSKEVVKLAMGLVATMAALVLGLLTASAKGQFDLQTSELQHGAANVIQLDRALARYGPETREIRDQLKELAASRLHLMWPEEGPAPVTVDVLKDSRPAEGLLERVQALSPQNDAQRAALSTVLQIGHDLISARWLVIVQETSPLPTPFLVVLTLWLSVLFGSFGLFAPRNATVVAALLLCAIAVSSSIFLILEMNTPLHGLIKISSAPLRYALSQLER
jgi:hypothetical protein